MNWSKTDFFQNENLTGQKAIFKFTDVNYDRDNNFFPFISHTKVSDLNTTYKCSLIVLKEEPLDAEEIAYINNQWGIQTENFELSQKEGISAEKQITTLDIKPFRKNKEGRLEKLVHYQLVWQEVIKPKINSSKISFSNYVANSILSRGDWYKLSVHKNGIYKVDKKMLQDFGIDVKNIDPKKIKLYGNGGKMLPEKNADLKYDDLLENAIFISGENDGVFDDEDFILFYGKGTHQWEYKPNVVNDLKFSFIKNYYADTTFYFLTIGDDYGKRIQKVSSIKGEENYISSSFDDFAFHEQDNFNLIKSGREYYGEVFDLQNEYTFGFVFPNIVEGDTLSVKTNIVGRNQFSNTVFNMQLPDNSNLQFVCTPVGSSYIAPAGDEEMRYKKLNYSGASAFQLKITKETSSSTGWLDYIRINARRRLIYTNQPLFFRDSRTIGQGRKTKFIVSNVSNHLLWDITDQFNVSEQYGDLVSGNFEFGTSTEMLKEFVCFQIGDALKPGLRGKVENQNLHAQGLNTDYIIVTHPKFKKQAEELALLHQQYDTLNYVIATPEEIYNEFSSGTQDVTAIREFVRMIYKKNTKKPRYLLLFGDGSYNNKNTDIQNNTNFIPTYQTASSLVLTSSKVIDDYYGFLDDQEGNAFGLDLLDIGIGRLPVKSEQEASAMVEKVKHYYLQENDVTSQNNNCNSVVYNTFGDWRNWITLMSDDAELGWELAFVNQHNEVFASQIKNLDPSFNIDKIYLDAYKQYATSGGQKYPDAEADLNKRIAKGALIFNYSGHGGELQLTSEAVIDNNVVNSWKNLNNLPMFVTATCEFSRFDDPARTSCGENVLLNPSGGGICLFTTTRIAYSSDANSLGPAFFNSALKQVNGWYPRTGDIIRLTKQGANRNFTHFCLLGDPAITLAYPKEHVYTTHVNGKPITENLTDTLKALSKVTIRGYLGDKSGKTLTEFNGLIYPTIFDKPSKQKTQGNDLGANGILNFNVQKNILYKGKVNVKNGFFEFSFVVPRDINYQFGNGKVSYYAHNGNIDASGYFENIIIGGSNDNPPQDKEGPEIKLYMNDKNFVFGGTTNENPKIYLELIDSSGINTTGNGIGHDLTAILDGKTTNPIVLNDFYESDLNSYQSGKIKYPLTDLAEGRHQLDVRVWDIQNNSSNETTEFVVSSSAELALKHVLNYPNPFSTATKFYIEHNQCCTFLTVSIQIFTVSGKLIKTINKDFINEGFRIEGIDWDGRDDFGDKLSKGVYIYKVKLYTADGNSTEKIEKLVILN